MSTWTMGRYCLPMADGKVYDSLRHLVRTQEEAEASELGAGREYAAIESILFGHSKTTLMVIPSYECNLRCPHCYVGHLLKRPSGDRDGSTDVNKLAAFMTKLKPLRAWVGTYVVGGEPFLHLDFMRSWCGWCKDNGVPSYATTNGMWDYDEVRDILANMTEVTFSIDGTPELHNGVRKSLQKVDDPFAVVYRNLRRYILDFPNRSVLVQGSLLYDELASDDFVRYKLLMVAAGVKPENVRLGYAVSTKKRAATKLYAGQAPSDCRTIPCCDYLLGKSLTVFENKVYHSYYQLEDSKPLGTLDDDPLEILQRHREVILSSMPLLHDRTCMEECDAVGVCWGYCSNARHDFKGGKPSTLCDRKAKREFLDKLVNGATSKGDERCV